MVPIELEGRRDGFVHLAAEFEEEEFGSPVATFEELGNALNGAVDSAMARLVFEPARFVREWLIGRAVKAASPCQTLLAVRCPGHGSPPV